jgi:hypothetical protein
MRDDGIAAVPRDGSMTPSEGVAPSLVRVVAENCKVMNRGQASSMMTG